MFIGMQYDPNSDSIVPVAIVTDPILSPDWTGFKSALFVDNEFDQLYLAAGQTNLLAKDALIPALLQYESGQTELFSMIFDAFCLSSGATIEQRQRLRTIAASFNLPTHFLNIINP
jgi:hypothetical protein